MSRSPLYTSEAARAGAKREGEEDDRGASAAQDGCGCCLIEGLLAFTSCVALVCMPLMLR